MKRPAGVCKDCWAEYEKAAFTAGVLREGEYPKMPRWRLAPKPGPRCVTHDRAETARRKLRTHALKVESGFGIPAEVYWALYEFQGGRCAILNCRATGKTRRLAVDHDRSCCPGRVSCGKCVRGLLCKRHNLLFGMEGDNPENFLDMAQYLRQPVYHRFKIVQEGLDPQRFAYRYREASDGLVGNAAASQTTVAAHLRKRADGDPTAP